MFASLVASHTYIDLLIAFTVKYNICTWKQTVIRGVLYRYIDIIYHAEISP